MNDHYQNDLLQGVLDICLMKSGPGPADRVHASVYVLGAEEAAASKGPHRCENPEGDQQIPAQYERQAVTQIVAWPKQAG